MPNLKQYFKFTFWFKTVKSQQAIGAVVYRIKGGQIEIFLSRKRLRRWHLPYILLSESEVGDAQTLLLKELTENHHLKQLQVWQSLGSFIWQARRRLKLQFLLIQLTQPKGVSDSTQEKMTWQSVDQALKNLNNDIMKQAVTLAVSKIKRARI